MTREEEMQAASDAYRAAQSEIDQKIESIYQRVQNQDHRAFNSLVIGLLKAILEIIYWHHKAFRKAL